MIATQGVGLGAGKGGECGRKDQEGSSEESGGSGSEGSSHPGGKWEGGGGRETGWLVEFQSDCWVSRVRHDLFPFAVAPAVALRWKLSSADLPHLQSTRSLSSPTLLSFVLLLRSLLMVPEGSKHTTNCTKTQPLQNSCGEVERQNCTLQIKYM